MNFVHSVLYLYAEDEQDSVQWGLEVFQTRENAIVGACEYLAKSGYDEDELAFARTDLVYENVHTARSLGLMVHLLMTEVK